MKKLFALLLAAVMLLTLAACGGDDDEAALPTPEAGGSAAPTEAPATESPAEESAAPEAIALEIGGSIDNDNFTMTFDSIRIVPEYKFRTSEYSTTSLYVEEGYQLLIISGHMTNNGMSVVGSSNFVFSGAVNGEYMLDNNDVRLNFIRSNSYEVDPYTDVDYVLSVNIPDKLAEIFETVSLTIGFNEDMSIAGTIINMDGTETLDVDCLYNLTGGLTAAE